MEDIPVQIWVLIGLTSAISWIALNDPTKQMRYMFNIGSILQNRQYERIVTSGFLHGNLLHLFINMYVLLSFGSFLYAALGPIPFFTLYFGSMVGGSALALFVRRNYPHYSAVGASGAISGLVLATCLLQPNWELLLFFIIPAPAWLAGIGFLVWSFWGILKGTSIIGHEAHMGGAMVGMGMTILFVPSVLEVHGEIAILFSIPILLFIGVALFKPNALSAGYEAALREYESMAPQPVQYSEVREEQLEMENELNGLLEKLREVGYAGMSDKDKQRMQELSQKIHGS